MGYRFFVKLKEKKYICERKDLSSLYENDTGNHTFVERL